MTTPNENKGNPAWKPILDVLPESLHGIVTPVLQEWDKGVQQRFQEIRSEYSELEPYKKFVEANIDPGYAEQAIILADQLQREPAKIVTQINEAWNLGFIPKDEAEKLGQSSHEDGDNGDLFDDGTDIFKDPRVKAMKEALDNLQTEYMTDKQREEQEEALSEFEDYLDTLEQTYTDPEREGGPLPFNRMFVTALISQGVDGETAVKQYHEVLAQNTSFEPTPNEQGGSSNPPPVVMGGEGSVGSGSPDGSVDIGSLSRKDLNATVEQLLAKAQEQGN